MKKTFILVGMVLVMVVFNASAINFDVVSLNSNGDPDAPVDWFEVGLVVNVGGTATFSIGNLVKTGNGTKISDIWLGTEVTVGDGPSTDHFFSFFAATTGVIGGSGTFNYVIDEAPNSNQGGVPWGVQVAVNATQGNDAATINPGETLTITYNLVNAGTTEQDLIDAFKADPQLLGIAFHVQSIPDGGWSEKYQVTPGDGTTDVPEGGVTLAMLGMALLGLDRIRRRSN